MEPITPLDHSAGTVVPKTGTSQQNSPTGQHRDPIKHTDLQRGSTGSPGTTSPDGAVPREDGAVPTEEVPATRDANGENFPVGSFLLPAHLRPHVATFYAFARMADDIADSTELSAEEKIDLLNAHEAALDGAPGYNAGYEKARALRESLRETRVTDRHARDLLAAFRQDAVKLRYANWRELVDYCTLSANPVGRFLIDLHGEPKEAHRASDALCTVLQVLNHLQDCGEDYRKMHRVYLPSDWMEAEGVSVADLAAPALEPGMRRVIDRCLDEVDKLLVQADDLAGGLASRRFAMECAVIVHLAHRLTRRLRAGDPLAGRVALSKVDFAFSGVTGAVTGFFSAQPSRRTRL